MGLTGSIMSLSSVINSMSWSRLSKSPMSAVWEERVRERKTEGERERERDGGRGREKQGRGGRGAKRGRGRRGKGGIERKKDKVIATNSLKIHFMAKHRR